MQTPLDQEWVNKVTAELETIYKFMDHTWEKQLRAPTAQEIAKEIQSLWRGLGEGDIEVGSGGLHVSIDDDGSPVVIYRKEIRFEYAGGESFSV